MASWLTYPLHLTGSRDFSCDEFTEDQCSYYMQRSHFWYIADYVYALPTVTFFMSAIGLFIICHVVSFHALGYPKFRGPPIWQGWIALIRYLSHRGFHVSVLRWNSAPIGPLLLGGAGAVYILCMDLIPQPYYWSSEDFGGSPPLGTRSGWMALACMPFVFATASKTNWITLTTGVSHEKIQVYHRWTAYAFFFIALMHTFPFIVYHIRFHDMVMEVTMMSTLFYWTGIVALVFQAWLTFASHSIIRRLSYEFFKAAHFLAVVVFVIVFFWHCDFTLTSWHYFIATGALYVPCFLYPWLRTAFEYGFTQKAHLDIEDNGFIRVTIPSVNMRCLPVQHCFLRFTNFGIQAFSSHPFTICSLPDPSLSSKFELVFYIRHSHGLTKRLHKSAQDNTGASVPVMVDGPYGGINMQRFIEAERLLVIAGGSGAGWALSLLELFCRRRHATQSLQMSPGAFAKNPEGETGVMVIDEPHQHRSLRIIMTTRDVSSRIWFLTTIHKLLQKYSLTLMSANIIIDVHLTSGTTSIGHEDATNEPKTSSFPSFDGNSSPERQNLGRPDLPSMIQQEEKAAAMEDESLSVYVCGPTTVQNDVRNAVAETNLAIFTGQRSGGVYLHSEHFSWA